ncbi:MAG: hypothetical protein IJ642_03035 [Oscillospiraceae bacterium]|nr:hypothetical protein [Oscillospiraceae bacterium]
MLTPFDSQYAENYLSDILKMTEEKQFPDTVAYIIQMTLHNYDEMVCSDELALKKCYEVWTAGCLLDSVFNHTDYAVTSDTYLHAVNSIEEAFHKTKRKFFKKMPIYNHSYILSDMFDALLFLTIPDDSELSPEDRAVMPHNEDGYVLTPLGGIMQEQGRFDQWEQDVMDVAYRLLDHTDEERKLQSDYNFDGVLK